MYTCYSVMIPVGQAVALNLLFMFLQYQDARCKLTLRVAVTSLVPRGIAHLGCLGTGCVPCSSCAVAVLVGHHAALSLACVFESSLGHWAES